MMDVTSDGATSTGVDFLVARSRRLAKDGETNDALTALQEASALESDNTAVRKAWEDIKSPGDTLDILCRSLTLHDETNDQDILHRALLASTSSHTEQDASHALKTLLDVNNERNIAHRDEVVGSLLSQSTAQKALGKMMAANPTATFHSLRHLGIETMQGLTKTCLSPAVWQNDEDRLKCVKDTFTLCLAMLLEPNASSKTESSMRTIASLMALHAPELVSLLNADNLAIILSFLDIAESVRLRSQATLVTAKFLEAAKDRGQSMLKDYVTSRIAKHTNDDIVAGFSAAGAMFPITPDVGSSLFLTPGFIDDLARVVQKSTSTRLRHSALELLSAACINKNCRVAIRTSCMSWLQDVVRDRPSEKDTAMAALVMSKISQESSELDIADMTTLYKDILMTTGNDQFQTAIEGLAYSSMHPKVKEEVAKDTPLLKRVIGALSEPQYQGPFVFGGLTIFLNLTTYPPEISAEQKRMDQLKAYANQSKPAEPSPLDNVSHVTARAKKTIDVGIVALLKKVVKTASPTLLNLVASIAVNLTRERKHCGKLYKCDLANVDLMRQQCVCYSVVSSLLLSPSFALLKTCHELNAANPTDTPLSAIYANAIE